MLEITFGEVVDLSFVVQSGDQVAITARAHIILECNKISN